MTKVIYKYTVQPSGEAITLPVDAEILSAAFQGKELQLWALVDPARIEETKMIEVFGTGHPIKEEFGFKRKFIDTVFTGPFVFHVFEKEKSNV